MKVFTSKPYRHGLICAVSIAGSALIAGPAVSQDAPFGNQEDVEYAQQLWDAMAEANLVGEGAISVRPFEGSEPHGTIQEVLATTVSVGDRNAELLVKRNHGGEEGLTVQDVYDDPTGYLAAITIMYKREEGYDPENQNWFWAKYLPDGSLDTNPAGIQLAGRVAKGMDQGCIACHTAAGGEDLETLTSR